MFASSINRLCIQVLLVIALMPISACRAPSEPRERPFPNVDAAYVGDDACFDCHEDEWRGYQSHGMANSIYPLTLEHIVEAFPMEAVRHEQTGLYYRAFREGDRLLQEEYLLNDAGAKMHSLVREMSFVVGSGTAARTYLTESEGWLYEMPLTWYTQSQHWDFSPGYATQTLRFDRLIPERCMACHNSYPEAVPHATGKYRSVPEGIGCERCHGPGALHVDARLASPEAPGEVDSTIVNPAHLSLDLRLDVCQQCHLNGDVSILREGKGPFDFRPSQSLASYMALFSSTTGSQDQISVISHADRMKQSPCFLETQNSAAPMDCTTCHDPHRGFRDLGPSYFNDTCEGCHSPDDLQDRVAAQFTDAHTQDANCFSCHMPRVEAEDAPHASFTDHFIRVVRDEPVPERAAADRGELEAYFERDRQGEEGAMYSGIAYIVHGRQIGDVETVERGIEMLRAVLSEVPDSSGEAHFNLGLALQKLGRTEESVAPLETSVRRSPDVPERLNALAQTYEAEGSSPQIIERLYNRALEIQPALADVRVNYGRFLETQQRPEEAEQAYGLALEAKPWLETAHFNLGTLLLRRGDFARARASLQRAVQLNPAYAEARGNLALLHLQVGDERAARMEFETAVDFAPDNPVALANLGTYYLNSARMEEATALLQRAVEKDPTYVTAIANLALAYVNLDRPAEARVQAERALRLDPSNQTALRALQAVR